MAPTHLLSAALLSLVLTSWRVPEVEGHGRMIWPPSRASAWRLGLTGDTPRDYTDNEGYCGGQQVQWYKNGGRCGICGDDWSAPAPRAHERPDGTYVIKGSNFILSSYPAGSVIDVKIQITASHKGYFEFFLCKVDSLPNAVDATWECLQQRRLNLTDGSTRYGNDDILNHYGQTRQHNVSLQLPPGLACKHCVLQWRYTTNNGFGDKPEQFFSCADLSVVGNGVPEPPPPPYYGPYIPTEIEKQLDKYPYQLTTWDNRTIQYYKCNYCSDKAIDAKLTGAALPAVCIDFSTRACPR